MRDGLLRLVETAELAIGSCAGVLTGIELLPMETVVRSLRARLAYPEDILVVALAGGTGSGKSSLFNALAGEELADVGGVRPTTGEPEAAVPREASGALDGYLDYLEVSRRHVYDGGLACLLDLPDTDSITAEHRRRVDALLPLVDVIVWVTDPEKYRDARLHREYLQPRAMYASQFICVLNQSDRLPEDQLMPVLADLSRALGDDGLDGVPVVATAASTAAGPPMGIDELAEELEVKREHRATLYDKILTDLERAVSELDDSLGAPVEFDEMAGPVVDAAVTSLAGGDTAGAIAGLVSFVDGLADGTAGVTGESLRRLAGEVPAHVARIGAGAGARESRGWWFSRRDTAPDVVALKALVNEAVIRPGRALLAKHALARAAVVELALETARFRTTTTR